MKRLLLLLCFGLLISLAGICPPAQKGFYIFGREPINPYERLYLAVCLVESSNNPLAYNSKENAVGISQIRQVRLNDYNRQTGKRYTLREMYDPYKSKEVFMYYAGKYPYTDYETIARAWNGSGKATIKYWARVKSKLKSV
jgi:hypothetical protein